MDGLDLPVLNPLRMFKPCGRATISRGIYLQGFPDALRRLPSYCGSLELTVLFCSITQLFEQGPSLQVVDLKAQNLIALTNA